MGVAVVVPRLCMILEASVLTNEAQSYRADGAVTVLTDNHLGYSLVRRVLVVDFVSIDEGDNIRVLLDRTRFTQVRHYWPFVWSLLEATIELRQCYNWTLELTRQQLQ